MTTTMADAESTIPAPQTPAEIAIHIGYLRRDIAQIGERYESGMKELFTRFETLTDHFITEAEFRPVADQGDSNAKDIKALNSWKDNLQGRMAGFAVGISAASALGGGGVVVLLSKLFGGG